MIEACDALAILRTKNRTDPAWINRGLYRLLYNPTLYVLAYERLKSKPGNMTPGTDGQTLDGYSLDAIQGDIARMRTEQYRPTPVRRTYIPKPEKGKCRPLGVPAPREKVVQECLRLILEAIYEPTFHDNSHGFRPGRSCHTALESLRRNWVGTTWVLKLDIADCFERIDHHRLLDILREKIADDRFINLIRKFLNAGYLENWVYHRTYSGTPQGSVISPILTNIYLATLDRKLEAIAQHYQRGKCRKHQGKKIHLMQKRQRWLQQGEIVPALRASLKNELRALNRRLLQTPTYDYHDSSYLRVKFLRYADDVMVGVIGPKALTEQVKEDIATFLQEKLKLELNEKKTRLIHLPTERARFLGYDFKAATARLRRRNLRRKGSPHNVVQTVKTNVGNIKLLVPLRELSKKLDPYLRNGKPKCRAELIGQSVESLIAQYNAVIRGWYNYYQLAENVSALNYARYVLHYSLAQTLARKEKLTVRQVFHKHGKPITAIKPNGRAIQFYNEPLIQVKKAQPQTAAIDKPPHGMLRRTRTRLLNNCAICGETERVEMHHIRHLRHRGQTLRGFARYLAAINRKQLPVCHQCHRHIHNGSYDGESLSAILKKLRPPNP